ncbi:pelargonidin 3-O-(6-caffeoylglucoside) 5-O-(6-O-malonylglucoside) 4'''-malonyltransferase-like [Heracleum sosnowskyi]|uniref:Pelargonidin 3-O-(6-caffeoylglucoside) 5-O-(6-O-malonylglucoside) 4'''-malonyltransferase-like n=1 Tax=Heracleum sosnowskyi TaxID=360622 RepID=A0AAD8HK64_9APIA|nr:pelargonidin 3-O-(6-caffeoylglucoside) 5-O-(6-O-malonylglucoside) 4'''-malonyltransferase-like [Heracleum sosnowskyi]
MRNEKNSFLSKQTLSPYILVLLSTKNSLSKALSSFYPFAGRYRIDTHSVNCGDQGAEFVQAKVDIRLDDLVSQRMNVKAELLNDLVPCPMGVIDGYDDPLLAVQVNAFSCGGFAITVCTSHRIADMQSVMSFVSAWAIATKQELGYVDENYQPILPNFDSGSLFPGKMLPCIPAGLGREKENFELYKIVTKMFYFDKSKISSIRERARLDDSSLLPSKVQSISGLIGKAIIDVHVANPENPNTYTIIQAVNIRKRTVLPLPDNQFGNLYILSSFQSAVGPERVASLATLVNYLSKSVKGVVDACATVLLLEIISNLFE